MRGRPIRAYDFPPGIVLQPLQLFVKQITSSQHKMADIMTSQASGAELSSYPAATQTVSATIAGVDTTVTRIYFSDKILVTVSQAGRLNHWVHVPLLNQAPSDSSYLNASVDLDEERPDSTLLPLTNLTATTVFGGTKPEFEVLGQTLATTLASAMLMRTPEESRMLVLGVGLERADSGREGFEGLVGLCLDVI